MHTQKHLVKANNQARLALKILDELPDNAIRTIFVIDANDKIIGSLSDGDIRRGLLNGLEISNVVEAFMNANFKYLKDGENNVDIINAYRKSDILLLPLLDTQFKLLQILDLRNTRTMLPVTALIMAGGRGERLKPFTDVTPKPMLKVGNKPIIEHNIDRLIAFGISDIYISVKYLKDHIMEYFGDGSAKGIKISYIEEEDALGTIGALSMIGEINHEDILVMNSDLLTNVDFEDFYSFYKQENATMAVVSIPYTVNIPYAVLQTNQHEITAFTEKPTFTYYSNGGIYILKFRLKQTLPSGSFYNATDLMDQIILQPDSSLVHYPLLGYWLDIGKHQDYIKAQEDINHLSLI